MPLACVLAALAVCATALAGCGSCSKPRSPESGGSQTLKFAHCMRSKGVTNYPDPSSNGRLQPINQIDSNSPTLQRTYEACRKDAASGQSGPPAPTAAEGRAAVAFAQCMPKHGLSQSPIR